MDWRDLRCVLAVADHGGLRQAGRALHIDPTTVSRRVSAIEADLGVELFVREPGRWRPTPAGAAVARRCERMALEVRGLRNDVSRANQEVRGRVRISAVDALLQAWILPHLTSLRRAHPALQVELFVTNENVDLTRGHADIALRFRRPDRASLRVRRLATVPLVVASTPALADRPVADRPVVLLGFTDYQLPENDAVRACGGDVAFTSTSLRLLFDLVMAGHGIGLVPAILVEDAGLVVLGPGPARELWRAMPEELARAPRIRAVVAWLDALFPPG